MTAKQRKTAPPKKRRKTPRSQRKAARPKPVQTAPGDIGGAQELTVAGVQAQQAGDLKKAALLYRKALKLAPNYAHAIHFLGVVHHQRGDNQKSCELIERAISIDPGQANFFSNLGAVQMALGLKDNAISSLREAVRLNPADPGLHINLATALRKAKQWNAAIEAYQNAPVTPITIKRLGDLFSERKRFPEAVHTYKRYLKLVPDNAEVVNNLGFALEQTGDAEAAERMYRRAHELIPDSPELANNLAMMLNNLGRGEEAEQYFEIVRNADPMKWEHPENRGTLLTSQGRFEEALKIYKGLLDANPDDKRRLNDYGLALVNTGRPADAIEYFSRAIELDSNYAIGYNNRAGARSTLADRVGAVEDLKKALSLQPGLISALVYIGVNLLTLMRYDEAYFYSRMLVMAEDYVPAHYGNPHKVFRSTVDFDAIAELGDLWEIASGLSGLAKGSIFLEMLVLCETREQVETMLGFHRDWYREVNNMVEANSLPSPSFSHGGKVRLGFLSSDLRSHSVAKFVMPLFSEIDRERFEIFCYSPIDATADANQKRFQDLVDKFRIVSNKSDREIAQAVRDDQVDILFELNGFTQNTRIGAMAYRAAPVQIEWLGYPFSTGIDEVDYLLLDPNCRPQDDSWLVEKVLEMPESWVCFGEYQDDLIIKQIPQERNDGVISFGTLNNPYKITPAILDLWTQVMHRVPNSRFLFVRPECRSKVFMANVCKEFDKRGIEAERLFLVDNRNMRYELDGREFQLGHAYYYDEIDVSLDTFPVTGGTTTCDALWMGVPVVSLFGPSLHHRISYSIIKNAGYADLCTESREEFVEIAVNLAGDMERLRDIRHNTRDRLRASPLCDAPRFARNFEKLMLELVERHKLR